MRRRIIATLVGSALALWPAGPAAAAWSAPGHGTGRATASTLLPPATFTASCNLLLGSSITLTWSVSATPWVDGYQIGQGSSAGNYTWGPIVTGTTWSTPALGIGTYHFAVRSTRGAWRSAATADRSKTIVLFLACL